MATSVAVRREALETRGWERALWISRELEMAFESFSSHCWTLGVRDMVVTLGVKEYTIL